MVRTAARMALGALLLGVLLGCAGLSTRAPRPASPVPAAVTPGPTLPPTPTAGPLPSVIAQVSLALPGGEAYQPQAVAFDGAGRAVALCYDYGQPQAAASGLVVLDLLHGARGPAFALPGHTLGPLAAAGSQAYVAYEDREYHHRLASVDLATGRLLADVPAENLYYGETLAADPAGRLYALTTDQLQVRDPSTLQVVRSLAYTGGPGERGLALDAARDRLYVAAGDRLQAYRASDLALLWTAAAPPGLGGRLVLDRAGRRVYAACERYEGDTVAARLFAFAADSGQSLQPPLSPQGTSWRLVAADSDAGRLTFAQPERDTHLWLTDLAGRPAGVEATLSGYRNVISADPQGRLVAPLPDDHLLTLLDPVDLRQIAEAATGIEIRHVLADPARERLYVNDSAGRLHVLDTRRWCVQASLPADSSSPAGCGPAAGSSASAGASGPLGTGPLALDAANDLFFVSRSPWGQEVTVLGTDPLAVTGVITGGDRVAIDSAGRRAFVGWATWGMDAPPGEVQVWDTRALRRLGAIAHRGAPTYNPLRDEVYLRDYSAYVADGKSLAIIGELTPDVGGEALKWCNGCPVVDDIAVDPDQDVIVASMMALSAGKGPGAMPQPRLFSARTLQPVTHTVTVLNDWQRPQPFILPADGGRVYEGQRYARYVAMYSAVAYPAGSATEAGYRDGLKLDYYLPGPQVALSLAEPYVLAFNARTWEPLGRIPYQPIQAIDPASARLYAWDGSLLTALSFAGAAPLPPEPAEPWPAGQPFESVREIHLSPSFERDHTVFVVAGRHILRSTDGGKSWVRLRGDLPELAEWDNVSYRLAVSPAYEQDRTLFAAGQAGDSLGLGVWRSTDGGESWVPAWEGLRHLKVERLAVSPHYAEDRTVLAYCRYNLFWKGDAGTSLFRSSAGGSSWAQVAISSYPANPAPLPEPADLLPVPAAPIQFKPAEGGSGVSRSDDGGRTWRTTLSRAEQFQPLLAVAPSPHLAGDQQVFALFPDLLYRSADGGRTWQAAADPDLVRPDYQRAFTALAVGLQEDGRLVLFLGDSSGRVLPVDPGRVRWGGAPTPTPAAGPGPAASPSATACDGGAPPFEELYDSRWHAALGCAAGQVGESAMAAQWFEHGRMFWRADRREVYVLRSVPEGNLWSVYPDAWQEGQQDRDPALTAPAGLQQPVRGFGKLWREQLAGPGGALGWAKEPEQGYSGRCQSFAGGILLLAPEGRVYALLADGHWESE